MNTPMQLTRDPWNHILTNANVWSPDSRWIVYDTRADRMGGPCDPGARIERLNVETGDVEVLYAPRNDAGCGAATYHPKRDRAIFIHGPERPTPDWSYGPAHRHGAIVDCDRPGIAQTVDARDVVPPFTPGALRGGSHVHTWDGRGEWISFTYEDHVLSGNAIERPGQHMNLRNVGISIPSRPVSVGGSSRHSRNHDGSHFSAVVSRTTANPRAGSDEIERAFEDAWIGIDGYARADGSRQRRAIAMLGRARAGDGSAIDELFVIDLPDDPTRPGDEPLEGTATTRCAPPAGVAQRRITRTENRRHPGLQGPRFWPRSSSDGSKIAVLARDDGGVVQVFTTSPTGDGALRQITRDPWNISSCFTWSPGDRHIVYAADRSIFAVEVAAGRSARLTPRVETGDGPSELAAVVSPDGKSVAFSQIVQTSGGGNQQIFVARMP